MANIPSTSTSRVGRPRTESAHQTPCVLVEKPKVSRPRSKSALASKITDSSKKPKGKRNPCRPPKQVKVVPIEKRVIEIDSDNSEEVEFPFYQLELPDLPPMEPDQPNQAEQPNQTPAEEQQPNQVPNQPLDTPMEDSIQPLDTPVEESNQPNQPLNILPDPMANPQQLNWSYFKPEFTGKTDEDAEAHLLRTNDWMDTHNFLNDQKVRRFCFTLTSKARLYYETIRNVNLDWPTMQEHFKQQYSKFGNTREQYFQGLEIFSI